jgi:hypothetical protein
MRVKVNTADTVLWLTSGNELGEAWEGGRLLRGSSLARLKSIDIARWRWYFTL